MSSFNFATNNNFVDGFLDHFDHYMLDLSSTSSSCAALLLLQSPVPKALHHNSNSTFEDPKVKSISQLDRKRFRHHQL